MSDVVDLAKRRPPVWYTVRIGHHWDDSLEVVLEDVAADPRSRRSVMDAMQRVCGLQPPADALHKELLRQVDDLMDAKEGSAEAARLAALADLVQAYEQVRYANPQETI